jgi:glutathione S-transferase
MKLYSFPGSPNALRSRAVIYELEAPVEIVTVDMRGGANKTPEFLAMNPNAKVPVFVDGDLVIWESRAINAYLASRFPDKGLYPADPAGRAMVDQWSYWQAIHLGPAMQKVTFERVQKKQFGRGEPDEAAIAAEMPNVNQFLDVFEAALGDGRDWITGKLSLADFALATTFRLRKAAQIPLETRPRVEAWMQRMEQRPSWQKVLAEVAG